MMKNYNLRVSKFFGHNWKIMFRKSYAFFGRPRRTNHSMMNSKHDESDNKFLTALLLEIRLEAQYVVTYRSRYRKCRYHRKTSRYHFLPQSESWHQASFKAQRKVRSGVFPRSCVHFPYSVCHKWGSSHAGSNPDHLNCNVSEGHTI